MNLTSADSRRTTVHENNVDSRNNVCMRHFGIEMSSYLTYFLVTVLPVL